MKYKESKLGFKRNVVVIDSIYKQQFGHFTNVQHYKNLSSQTFLIQNKDRFKWCSGACNRKVKMHYYRYLSGDYRSKQMFGRKSSVSISAEKVIIGVGFIGCFDLNLKVSNFWSLSVQIALWIVMCNPGSSFDCITRSFYQWDIVTKSNLSWTVNSSV